MYSPTLALTVDDGPQTEQAERITHTGKLIIHPSSFIFHPCISPLSPTHHRQTLKVSFVNPRHGRQESLA